MKKSTVTGIHPAGATLARADGSPIRVGEEVGEDEAVTLTIPAGASGGVVTVPRDSGRGPRITERRAQAVPPVETDDASPRRTSATRAAPPALKVTS